MQQLALQIDEGCCKSDRYRAEHDEKLLEDSGMSSDTCQMCRGRGLHELSSSSGDCHHRKADMIEDYSVISCPSRTGFELLLITKHTT